MKEEKPIGRTDNGVGMIDLAVGDRTEVRPSGQTIGSQRLSLSSSVRVDCRQISYSRFAKRL